MITKTLSSTLDYIPTSENKIKKTVLNPNNDFWIFFYWNLILSESLLRIKIGYMLFFIKNTIFIILDFLLSCKIVISCTIIPLNIDLFSFNFFNLEFYLNFSSFSKKHRKLHCAKKKHRYFLRCKKCTHRRAGATNFNVLFI
jgi:hypothetical protein